MHGDRHQSSSITNQRSHIFTFVVREKPTPAVTVRTYLWEELELVGETRVRVHYGQQEEALNLLVVKGNGPNLLSRDWLAKFKLDWKSIRKLHHQDSTLEEVLEAHSDLFSPRLGTITGTTAKLYVDPAAKPRFVHHDQSLMLCVLEWQRHWTS